uniref:Uncharacterized protein n=1 Tax=Arundo donax TaxID=35708 RepID=A0A0A8ZCL3_ARUDO
MENQKPLAEGVKQIHSMIDLASVVHSFNQHHILIRESDVV